MFKDRVKRQNSVPPHTKNRNSITWGWDGGIKGARGSDV